MARFSIFVIVTILVSGRVAAKSDDKFGCCKQSNGKYISHYLKKACIKENGSVFVENVCLEKHSYPGVCCIDKNNYVPGTEVNFAQWESGEKCEIGGGQVTDQKNCKGKLNKKVCCDHTTYFSMSGRSSCDTVAKSAASCRTTRYCCKWQSEGMLTPAHGILGKENCHGKGYDIVAYTECGGQVCCNLGNHKFEMAASSSCATGAVVDDFNCESSDKAISGWYWGKYGTDYRSVSGEAEEETKSACAKVLEDTKCSTYGCLIDKAPFLAKDDMCGKFLRDEGWVFSGSAATQDIPAQKAAP